MKRYMSLLLVLVAVVAISGCIGPEKNMSEDEAINTAVNWLCNEGFISKGDVVSTAAVYNRTNPITWTDDAWTVGINASDILYVVFVDDNTKKVIYAGYQDPVTEEVVTIYEEG